VASGQSTASDGKQSSQYILKTTEFEPIAEIISENASKIPFPYSVETVFDRVISGRKAVNEEHRSLPKGKRKPAQDKSHEHFIAIVERAYENLKPYVTVKLRKETKPSAATVENSFTGLTVEDTSESPDAGVTELDQDAEDELPNVPPVEVEKSQEELEDDFHFQIWMLLDELHKIEAVALDLWKLYADGKADLIVASLATNIAIDFVRQAEVEFEDTVVRPKKFPASKFPVWTLPAVAYNCVIKEFDDNPREEVVKPGHPESMNVQIMTSTSTGQPLGTEEMCYMFVYWGLNSYVHALMLERATNPKAVSTYIPEPDVEDMKKSFSWPDKVFRTIELLPQYLIAISTWDDEPFLRHDEISAGVQCLVDEPSVIPLWATFGINLFLDIQTTLGAKQNQAFAELQEHLHEWQTRVSLDRRDSNVHFKRDIDMMWKPGGEFTFDENRERPEAEGKFTTDPDLMEQTHVLLFKHLYAAAQIDTFRLYSIQNDPKERSATSTTTASFATPLEREDFYFLKRHPVRCGLMKHHLYSRLHELRFQGKRNLTNMTWLVHLYHASKIFDPEAPVWPDMEFIIARQGTHLFDGAAPTTIAESLYKLKKCAGVTHLNTPRETYKPAKAHTIKSPRGVGAILADQISPEERKEGNVYHTLRRFICAPSNRTHLYAQLNIPSTSPPPYTPEAEPRYAALLHELGTYWLPADLVDLYFDWPSFSRVCLSRVIMAICIGLSSLPKAPCSPENMFVIAKFVLEYAVGSPNVKRITLEREVIGAEMPLKLVAQVWKTATQVEGVVKDLSGHYIWEGDRGLVRAVQRSAFVREVLEKEGEFGKGVVYKGWKRADKRKSLFWKILKEGWEDPGLTPTAT
jgi:hypothetical protein